MVTNKHKGTKCPLVLNIIKKGLANGMNNFMIKIQEVENDMVIEIKDWLADLCNIEEYIFYKGYGYGKMTFTSNLDGENFIYEYDVYNGTLTEESEYKKGNKYVIDHI